MKGGFASINGSTLTYSHSDVPGIAGANVDLHIASETSTTIAGQHTTDFVWAVRLAKVHKGFLSTDWSVQTYTQGATFSTEDEDLDIAALVDSEGLPREDIFIIEDTPLDCAIVLSMGQ